MSDSLNRSLRTALAQLRSEDVRTQNKGVEAITRIGAAAVPELLPLLDDKSAGLRAQTMYALAQIAVPEAAEAFQHGLHDTDERVRAYAATGLARIAHDEALSACIRTLNDAPDEMHLDITPSVHALGEMGMRAVPPLLDLMLHDDEMTRLHAQRALELIISRRFGFQPGQGFPTKENEEQSRATWLANGDYDYAADAANRAAAVEKWRHWLASTEE